VAAGLALGLSGVHSAHADDVAGAVVTARPGVLNLRTGDVDTAGLVNLLDLPAFDAGEVSVILLDGPITVLRRKALADVGVTLMGYLPSNAFLADLGAAPPAAVKGLGFVMGAHAYQKSWKIDPVLRAGAHAMEFQTPERVALAANGDVGAVVWLFAGRAARPTLDMLAQVPGARVISSELVSGTHSIAMTLPAGSVGALADLPDVQYAEPLPEYSARSNANTRWIVQSNVVNSVPLYDRGINGTGQIIAIIDGGLAQDHCSFQDLVNPFGPLHRKIQAYNVAPQFDFHGTHVAGTAAGDAGTTGDTRGVAYGARIVFNLWPSMAEASHLERYNLHYSQGAAVHSNSWGTNATNAYDGGCRAIDSFQHDLDDNLILFAVTNDPIAVRNPENAKNALAVSATGNAPSQNGNPCAAGGSSFTADGRRKPEVTAPGCGTVSASSATGCSTFALNGTSMATPAAAGTAVLMRQYFTSGFYPSGQARPEDAFTPSGALLKAAMVNSARDMTGNSAGDITKYADYPNAWEGWGRVLADDTVYFAGDQRRLIVEDVRNAAPEALETAESSTTDFYVNPCSLRLRVTLAYHDAPAEVNAALTPVNNLDLVVTSPSGVVYRGNFFDEGFSIPGGTADALNNLEQVHINSPEFGVWHAQVIATAVQAGPQGFALVVTGGVEPLGGCGSADFNCDGDVGTDLDIEAFFAAMGGAGPGDADFDRDGDTGTDADIEAFFRVLGGGNC